MDGRGVDTTVGQQVVQQKYTVKRCTRHERLNGQLAVICAADTITRKARYHTQVPPALRLWWCR